MQQNKIMVERNGARARNIYKSSTGLSYASKPIASHPPRKGAWIFKHPPPRGLNG